MPCHDPEGEGQSSDPIDTEMPRLTKGIVQGGTIRDSLNLPAQTLWYSLDALYELCDAAGVSAVVFYCGLSSSPFQG